MTIIGKAIWRNFFTFQPNFGSPQVKENQVIITKGEYIHKMPNDLTLRTLENEKTSEPTTQKANFGSYSTYCIIVIPGIIVLLLYQALP